MNLLGTFEGTFEATFSMSIDEHDWELFLEVHPDFDEFSRISMNEAWEYFKAMGYYDEPESSVDFDTTMTGLEILP
jgi:hypothetical protein